MKSLAAAAMIFSGLALGGCGSGTSVIAAPNAPAAVTPALEKLPSAQAQSAALAKYGAAQRPVFCGGTAKPWVALTFDDGPGPYTRNALGVLRHAHAPATFFVVGRNVGPYKSSLKAERNYNAPIGDHSFTHPMLTALPAGQQRSQLLSTKSSIERAAGGSVRLFRPPYGAHDRVTDTLARRARMATILWNVDSRDSLGAGSKWIARHVIHGLTPGAIILMHENHGQTIRALKYTILPHLKHMKIRLVTVPQLLAGNPPTTAQLLRGRKGCR